MVEMFCYTCGFRWSPPSEECPACESTACELLRDPVETPIAVRSVRDQRLSRGMALVQFSYWCCFAMTILFLCMVAVDFFLRSEFDFRDRHDRIAFLEFFGKALLGFLGLSFLSYWCGLIHMVAAHPVRSLWLANFFMAGSLIAVVAHRSYSSGFYAGAALLFTGMSVVSLDIYLLGLTRRFKAGRYLPIPILQVALVVLFGGLIYLLESRLLSRIPHRQREMIFVAGLTVLVLGQMTLFGCRFMRLRQFRARFIEERFFNAMKCEECRFEWTPPPDRCPRCASGKAWKGATPPKPLTSAMCGRLNRGLGLLQVSYGLWFASVFLLLFRILIRSPGNPAFLDFGRPITFAPMIALLLTYCVHLAGLLVLLTAWRKFFLEAALVLPGAVLFS